MREFGVHSEVGKLRTVMVCRPSLAHQRLTPGNCRDLLFDDVIWVHEAQRDNFDFTLKMQERGVEVLELHDLLAETLDDSEARKFVLDRRMEAACQFAKVTGRTAAIGALADIPEMVRGERGTIINSDFGDITWHG
jgi:arginine deiminase